MRKSDYPKVHRRGAAGLVILLLLLLLLGAFAPAAMAADWPNCNWIQNTSCDAEFPPNKSCNANDGRINKAWLGYCNNATPIEPCTPEALVDNVCIWVEFNKGPVRYQIYSFFDLYIDDQYQGHYCDCNDTIPHQTYVTRAIYGPLQWTCGQELELKNILVAWTVNSDCNCSDPACCNSSCVCQHGHPKCWGPKDIIVRAPLVANFTHTAPQCYCTDINFYGTATGGTKSYVNWSWDFGDGNSSTGQNTSHHYGAAGTYTVNLTVTDSSTNTSRISKNVQVWPTPVANFTSNSPQIYCYNITFNGTATDGTPPYTYYWDFDDGNTSTEQNTSHRYSAPRTYEVILTVTDANGCTNSTTKPVVASGYTAGLAITKVANVTSATVGTVIGYTINVSNTGTANLTSVLVTDNLTGLNQTIPILAHGATQTFNTTHTVTEPEICAPISNTATANGTDPCGNPVGPVSASVIVTQGYTVGLAVVKTSNVTMPTVGTVIWYTINVSNTGNVNLSSVLVTDNRTGLNDTIPILAPRSFHIFNTTYTVTESDICGLIENRATANGTDPCGYLTPTAVGVLGTRP